MVVKDITGVNLMNVQAELNNLHEQDFYLWTQQQSKLLRSHALSEVDIEHLAEEIESMGNSDRRALESHLANIILHLLKFRYQPEKQLIGQSWSNSIWNGRDEIEHIISHNPSLQTKLLEMVESQYPRAKRKAIRETGLPPTVFPDVCPFSIAQILTEEF